MNSILIPSIQQPYLNSKLIKDIAAPCLSKPSAIIHQSCCKVNERLQMSVERIFKRKTLDLSGQINLILTNEKQLKAMQNSFTGFPYAEDYKITTIPWDLRFLVRWQHEYTNTRILIVKNKNITIDTKSGVPLPTSYFDQDTKEQIYTLKNEIISFIVIDDLSTSPNDKDFKSKLIESLLIEGKWAQHGINHNLIIPLFLNSNITDPAVIAFSGLVDDSQIFIGQAAKQAIFFTIWKYLNEKLSELIQISSSILLRISTQKIARYDIVIILYYYLKTFVMYLCQIYFQISVTSSDIWLKQINIYLNVLFNIIFLITVNIRHSEIKSLYLSSFLKHPSNHNQFDDSLNEFDIDEFDLVLGTIPECLNELPFLKHTSDSNSMWIIDQLLKATVELNISVFRLYLDDCDFDLNSNLNTGYQKDTNSGSFSKTTINLITYFSTNATFGKRIPLPLPLFSCLLMQFSDKYSLFAFKTFLLITMAFLKLTMNQIMYSPDNFLIPVWPSAVRLDGNKLMYEGLMVVLLMCRESLTHSNCVIIHNYIFELIYQTVCPLIDCKEINSSDIRSDLKTTDAWVELKQLILKLLQLILRPKQFVLTDYETLSMAEIIGKRWAHVDTQSASAKDGYLDVLYHLHVFLILNSKQNISSASMGLQRWNQYLSSEPLMFATWITKGATYTDEIRSALHFQFAMLFLSPEGLSRHFKELQENAWRCHPLYSPDRAGGIFRQFSSTALCHSGATG